MFDVEPNPVVECKFMGKLIKERHITYYDCNNGRNKKCVCAKKNCPVEFDDKGVMQYTEDGKTKYVSKN